MQASFSLKIMTRMKKRELLPSYTYTIHKTPLFAIKSAFSAKTPREELPAQRHFSYMFYTEVNSCITVQFKKLHDRQHCYRVVFDQSDLTEDRYSFIKQAHLSVSKPLEAIAQVIVDFMISQSKIKLFVERDLQLFKSVLCSLWTEFNALFKIKGLYNGIWSACQPNMEYEAYALTK